MRIFHGIVACIFLMFATACSKDNDNEVEKKPSHTLLIYMAGDNTLSEYCYQNIKFMKQGLLNSTEDFNLVIYKDNRSSGDALPELFQLKKSYDKRLKTARIDTLYLQRYNVELNSCDPSVLLDIVNTTFKTFDTEIKGLEMWSHGLSWIPANNYSLANKSQTRKVNYIGQDENSYLEIWDMRRALEKSVHLDYILFDACFMGTAEVANELDQVCDYIFAPITEIMGEGFPYHTIIPSLASCTSSNMVEPTLKELVGDYMNYYPSNGTITVLKTSQAASYANSLAKLRNINKERLENLYSNAKSLESSFQHYGRNYVGARYYFYDLKDYVNYLGQDPTPEIQSILSEFKSNSMLVDFASSASFDDGHEKIDLSGCKGIGISIPEFFHLQSLEQKERLEKVYGQTKWGKVLGY